VAIALIVVMGALVWRAQRQVTRLPKMTTAMQESLGRLEDTTKEVTRLAKTSGALQEALTRLEDATQEITASSAKTEEALIKTEESVSRS
jgi:flagellin-like hook-associated protein FlgL